MATVLEQVALGLDKAKTYVYDIMKQYFPKVDLSRSTLVNALVSGMSALYSMFQVFVKLIQDELYVSTAKEMESLYKLIPFVGIKLTQPTKMALETTALPQDDSITGISDPSYYIRGVDALTDADANKFAVNNTGVQYLSKRVKDVSQHSNDGGSTYLVEAAAISASGMRMLLSIGKILGSEYFPLSLYTGDQVKVEVPYRRSGGGTIQLARVTFTLSATTVTDSTEPTDVSGAYCRIDKDIGLIEVVLASGTFNDPDLVGQPINITMKLRSIYKRSYEVVGAQENLVEISFGHWAYGSAYDNAIIYTRFANKTDGLEITGTSSSKTRSLLLQKRIDPLKTKIRHYSDTDITFNFGDAEKTTEINNPFWGIIYKTSVTYAAVTYYAYILDKDIGLLWFEQVTTDPFAYYRVDYTEAYNSKMLLEQYEVKTKTIKPPTEMDFVSVSYDLEDTDIILFDEISIKINDPAYAALNFVNVENVDVVIGTGSTTYFEVQPLSTTKVRIRFNTSVEYSAIQSMTFTYNVIKNIQNYESGKAISGTVNLYLQAGTVYSKAGVTLFSFEGLNTVSQVGSAGVPTLESLRSTLEKAAYTYDRFITALNYEAAIQAYYISQGRDARVKVFPYEDFGTMFLDWLSGNVVFFMGVVNKYPNSNLVLVVPKELYYYDNDLTGGDLPACYRADLEIQAPVAQTDISLKLIQAIGEDSNEVSAIQAALRPYMVMTNYLLASRDFVRMWAVYFKLKIRAKVPYSFSEADAAARRYLANLFSWNNMAFVRDINVSDVYHDLDALPEIDKVLFSNFSHAGNADLTNAKVADIVYEKVTTAERLNAKYNITYGAYITVIRAYKSSGFTWTVSYDGALGKWKIYCDFSTAPGSEDTFVKLGFAVGMEIRVIGFTGTTAGVNNGIKVIDSFTDADKSIVIAGETLADRVQGGVKVKQNVDFVESGFTVGMLITTENFAASNNNRAPVRVSIVDADSIAVNASPILTNVSQDDATVIRSSRAEHPLWDFSTANIDRKIKIDVLGLGGIDTEAY